MFRDITRRSPPGTKYLHIHVFIQDFVLKRLYLPTMQQYFQANQNKISLFAVLQTSSVRHEGDVKENIIINKLFLWIARFYILKKMLFSIQMFRGYDAVSLIERYRPFRETLQGFYTPRAKWLTTEYHGATCLQNSGDYSPKQHHKTLETNFSIPSWLKTVPNGGLSFSDWEGSCIWKLADVSGELRCINDTEAGIAQ
jgi:hypothetical protein